MNIQNDNAVCHVYDPNPTRFLQTPDGICSPPRLLYTPTLRCVLNVDNALVSRTTAVFMSTPKERSLHSQWSCLHRVVLSGVIELSLNQRVPLCRYM